jgi:hypothetical protein
LGKLLNPCWESPIDSGGRIAHMADENPKPIHLTYRSVEQVVVEPDDQDRFVTTVRDAARACKSAQADAEWRDQFEAFLAFIHEWCVERTEFVDASFVGVGDGELRVAICTSKNDFDFDFEEEVTELDILLAQKFPQCISEVTQFPRSILTPADFSEAIMTYGDASAASSTSRP